MIEPTPTSGSRERDSSAAPDTPGRPIREGDELELSVPAVTAFVGVLRGTVAAVGARLDLDLDSVEDLRLAINEATALLLEHQVTDGRLSCRVSVEPARLWVRLEAAVLQDTPPSATSFAWTVLTALVPDVDVQASPGRLALDLWFPRPVPQ